MLEKADLRPWQMIARHRRSTVMLLRVTHYERDIIFGAIIVSIVIFVHIGFVRLLADLCGIHLREQRRLARQTALPLMTKPAS